MPSYTTEDIRNVALLGHAGAGKTTLTEALLHAAGSIGHIGSVETGDTVSDFSAEETAHTQSLQAGIVHFDYGGKHINLIDTAGAPDFLGQSIASLPAVETAAIVINADAGVESVARRMAKLAEERHLCRMIIINRIDSDTAKLDELLDAIQKTLGANCLPINLPAEGASKVVDCFQNAEGSSDLGDVADFHTAIIDQVVEVDEKLMETYLESGEVSPSQLHQPFEQALREGHLVPICFVAARPHSSPESPVGVTELLDVLVKLAPNPTEGNPRPFFKEGDAETEIHADPDASKPAIAHVFNVRVDPFVGKLCAFRVHQGTIKQHSQLFVSDVKGGESKKPLRISHLFKLQGKEHAEIKEAIPGDIAAVAKMDEIHHDAVLHESDSDADMHLLPLKFPEPMSGLAIAAKKRGDEQKIADALNRQIEEDPCFKVTRDSTTHETVIHGLGDQHLRVVLEKLKARYNVEVDTKPPKIAYRETIQTKAEGHHRHKKQTGGAGQFGEVYLRVEPLERGTGFEFSDDTFGGSVPQQFLPAIEKGVRQVLEQGAIAGYLMQDIKVSVYDGKHHPVDSKEVAFMTAGKRAFVDAVQKAHPVLLEPMVKLEVTVPNSFMGDITSDLSGKRGRIQGTDMVGSDQVTIEALVPLAEIGNYQGNLKSITGGQGSFTMELSHYDAVPSHVQEQIVAQYKPKEEED